MNIQHRTPGLYHSVDPDTCRPTPRPLRQTNEYIHPSVRTRVRLNGPGVADKGIYECRALTDNYRLVVDYSTSHSNPHTTPATTKPEPDIYWKYKFKDGDAVKIMPEAPLWGVEKELCRRDKETWEMVKRPPATGTSSSSKPKRRKSVRPASADMSGGRGANGGGGTRRSFVDDGHGHATRRSVAEKSEFRGSRARSKSRARSLEFERESVIRGEMPHRRQKDKAWWEGVAEGMGMRSGDADRMEKENGRWGDGERDRDRYVEGRRGSRVGNDGVRSPRRSSMRV